MPRKNSAVWAALLFLCAINVDVCQAFGTASSLALKQQRKSPASLATAILSASNNDDCDNNNGNPDSAALWSRRQMMTTGFLAASALAVSNVAVPEKAYAADTSLDFSLPSYDAKMKGFGEGSEVYSSKITAPPPSAATTDESGNSSSGSGSSVADLLIDPGASEKEKQARSMALAEEARKAALAKKKAEAKAREDAERRRAEEKKAKNAERFASIFN